MIFAFAPIVGLLLGVASITAPQNTLFLSVLIYIVIPVVIACLGRKALLIKGKLDDVLHMMDPISMAALATVAGVLVEVPVMLFVVAIVNRSKAWYESGVTTNTLTVEVKGD